MNTELLITPTADPTVKVNYVRDKVINRLLKEGIRRTVDEEIDFQIQLVEEEKKEERRKQREKDEQDARRRDENYYNTVAGAVGRGEILVLKDGAISNEIPESVYLHEDILLMGKLLLEKASGNMWYHYTPSWSLAELPVLSLKECTLITIRRPVIEAV